MPNVHSTLTSLFGDIADAIRAKTGKSSNLTADDFPQEIAAIPQGGKKPDFLLSDGDKTDTLYFNVNEDLSSWIEYYSDWEYDYGSGLAVIELGVGYLYAVNLAGADLQGEYALVWNDGTTPTPIYSSAVFPDFGVTTAGWQMDSFTASDDFTVNESKIYPPFLYDMDYLIAKKIIAFGDAGGSQGYDKPLNFETPSVNGVYTYSGAAQSPTVEGFYSDFMTASGDFSGTNAGSYSMVFTLKDTVNCQWRDGTTAAKTVHWSIRKASPAAPTLSSYAVTLNEVSPSASFTVTRDGDGTVSASSSDPARISASVNGTTVTVTALDASATVTANVKITVSAGSNYFAYTGNGAVCTVGVAAPNATKIYVTTTAPNAYVPLIFSQSAQNGVVVDWGDGSAAQTFEGARYGTGSNLDPYFSTGKYVDLPGTGSDYFDPVSAHTYAEAGDYVIKLTALSGVGYGISGFGGTSASTGRPTYGAAVLGYCGYPANPWPANVSLTKCELAEGCSVYDAGGYSGLNNCTTVTDIELPSDITSLPERFINGCSALQSLTVKAETPPTVGSNLFTTVPASLAIYVPAASVSAYRAAAPWSDRAAYIQAIPE